MVQKVQDRDFTSSWGYPLEQDGWYHAHNALRADLSAIKACLAAFKTQLAAGKPISPAQAAATQRFLAAFLKFFHHHHMNEEEVAIPYMSTRCHVPEKLTADHKELQEMMDLFEKQMGQLLGGGATSAEQQAPLLDAAAATFAEMDRVCREHLAEEEAEAMPLMRRHFTPKEVEKNVVSKIMRSMDGDGMGTFFRPMTKQHRAAFARQEGIPFFVRWILFHQANKFQKKVWLPFEREVLAGGASQA